MNATNPPSAEHQDIWELLPWLVNGRLNEGDRRRVETHLRVCGACRKEFAAQRQIYGVVSAATAVEQMPMAGLNKLRQRIETAERPAAADESAGQTSSPVARRAASSRRFRLRRAAVAASVVTVSIALGFPAAWRWNQSRHAPATYYTVTTATPQHPGEVIRAVFAPSSTLSELQAILDDAHLKIVSGPTEAGVYSLAMTGPQSIDWSLRRLRGHDTVRFAEALGPAAVPAPPP